MEIKCPECDTLLEVPDDQMNKKGRCLSCGVKFLIEESLINTDSETVSAIESNNNDVIEDQEKFDNEEVNSGFNANLNKTIYALFFTSFGILIGLIIGYFIGNSIGGNDIRGINDSMNSTNNQIIRSSGDTLDPFGIDYD
ncbi:MAG: hypothetical protein ACJ0IZ_07480 [Verrucomicrobiales bacterium]|nr:hypothetical protein [Verrucomicrobiales bacterium]